jgi:hypothetical protein
MNQTYTMGENNYMAASGDGYTVLAGITKSNCGNYTRRQTISFFHILMKNLQTIIERNGVS